MPPGDESWWMSDVPEPVLDGRLVSFILFGDEEPDELGVTHARVVAVGVVVARSEFGQFVLRCAARDGAREYPVDHPRTDGCANQMERFQTKSHAERERELMPDRITHLRTSDFHWPLTFYSNELPKQCNTNKFRPDRMDRFQRFVTG